MEVTVLTSTNGWGGVESHTLSMGDALVRRGHTVSIIQLGHRNYGHACITEGSGISLRHLEPSTRFDELGILESFNLLRKVKGDVCIFPKGHFQLGNWRFDFAARSLFRRYITIEHSLPPTMPVKSSKRHMGGLLPGVGWWWFKILLRRRLRGLGPNRVVCVSHAVRKSLIEGARIPSHKLTTIHNGIDSIRFHPNPEYRQAGRRECGVPDGAILFGGLGRFEKEKGYDSAIDLFKRLSADLPKKDLWLFLVGGGNEEMELRRRAADSIYSDRIKFASFSDRPWEVYPAFDVLLVPSLTEGLPLGLLEGMSCGCTAVATAVGGIPEIITSKTLGWLVNVNDRVGFLTAMKEAAESEPSRLVEMGRRARVHVTSNFNAQSQLSYLVDLIEGEFLGSKFPVDFEERTGIRNT